MAKQNKWRWGAITPSVWGIPVIAFMPLIIVAYCLNYFPYTLYVAIATIGSCALLNRYGYTLKVFIGKVKSMLRGPKIMARPWWYRKRFNNNK
ncbi:TPA: IcmT/TraK family protein [Salmonella enterica subsp. salamae serovar 35:g,m,s,t:-]|nr:IcmT/TraK family protein [Salmonella enterica subsp. salamae serovar 35:g,m,s,t:-]HCA3549698.1 IcmT/TraK family protein [Salmonella enterica subsp. salamae serovar 35:g,m,s,t:-]